MLNIICKTEAGLKTGYGHLKRLLHLFHGWKGAEPVFLSTHPIENFPQSHKLHVIKGFKEFSSFAKDCDLLLIDEPSLDKNLFKALDSFQSICAFDELGPLREKLDLHFLTTLGGLENRVYQVGKRQEYQGCGYFIYPPKEEPAALKNDTVLVCFGGSDPTRLSEKFLDSLKSLGNPENVALVLGPGIGEDRRKSLKETAMTLLVQVLDMPESLVSYYRAVKKVLTCGGVSAYEALHFGAVPYMFSQNKEQEGTAKTLENSGFGQYFGDYDRMTPQVLEGVLAPHISGTLRDAPDRFRELSGENTTFKVREIMEKYAKSRSL